MEHKKSKPRVHMRRQTKQQKTSSCNNIQDQKPPQLTPPSKLRRLQQALLIWTRTKTIESGFKRLLYVRPSTFVILFSINFICGLTILYITDTMQRFLPHLILLTVNMSITIMIGRHYVSMINTLSSEIEGKHLTENIELKIVFQRFKKYTFKKINLLPCLGILGVFFWGIFSQNYIKLDLVGGYAVFIVCVAVSISVLGYIEYIWLLWLLFRASKCSTMYFNRSNPAQTPFLVCLAQLTNRAKWCFFIEGFIYVFEYFILTPPAQLTLPTLQMPNNVSFLITWLILFIVIVLAFPTIVIIQETLIAKIISNLKHERVEQLSGWFDLASYRADGSGPPTEAYMYDSMIANVLASEDYPAKIRRLGPVLITVATVSLHIVTLIGQFPQLKLFFQSIGI